MPKKIQSSQLLVEGKNDRHVIWALCLMYQLPETFSVEVANVSETEGIEALLNGLPLKLREKNLEILGIVVDADQDLAARWQAVKSRLRASGYQDIPETPPESGFVHIEPELPKVGVWLMPNNQLPGMLEDFVKCFIPNDDRLLPKAELVLQEIEQANLNPYTLIHRPKALIHT